MKKISKKYQSLFLILIILNLSFSQNTASSQNNLDSVEEIEEKIKDLMKDEQIQSMSTCIIENNSIIWSKGFGIYNKLPRRLPNLNTIYMLGSISKCFTATAMMQIIENETFNVSLDDDVNKFLPFKLRNPNYPDTPITIRMLLSHRSSLNMTHSSDQITLAPFFYLRMNLKNMLFNHLLLRFVFSQYLIQEGIFNKPYVWTEQKPGEKFYYSDFGFDLLTYIIEIISGEKYNEYCNINIFEPLDMKNTSFNYKNLPKNQHSHPYVHFESILIRPIKFYNIPYYGSGSIHSTAEDLSHFLIAHMNNGTYRQVQILNETSIESMQSIYYHRDYINPNGIFDFEYGMGFCIWNNTEDIFIGHFGSYFGFDAIMKYRTSDKIGVILFFDTFLGIYPSMNNTEKNMETLRQANVHKEISKKIFDIADILKKI